MHLSCLPDTIQVFLFTNFFCLWNASSIFPLPRYYYADSWTPTPGFLKDFTVPEVYNSLPFHFIEENRPQNFQVIVHRDVYNQLEAEWGLWDTYFFT